MDNAIKLEKIRNLLDSQRRQQEIIANTIEALEMMEKEGLVNVESVWGITSYLNVQKSQLSAIRKLFGRLTMMGKDTASDFDETNDIIVSMAPTDKKFSHMRFQYRTKYRRGGKCKVVSQVEQYKSLVCER
jgi:hypothetical protein